MCGIAGAFNMKQGVQPSIALALLAVEMESRGDDSWGSTDGKTLSRCMGAVSSSFVVPEILPENFALHTRFATQGKVKESNSHPFVVSGKHLVVGMHNGIISNHDQLNTKYKRNYRVDSQHLFGHLANDLSLDDIEGYGTIVYKKNDDWYVGSFNNGEFALSYTNFGLFFASTQGALARALHTARIDGNVEQLNQNRIYKLVDNILRPDFDVHIAPTKYKWDDKKKGGHKKSYDVEIEEGCLSCGGRIWEGDSTYCDLCLKYGDITGNKVENPDPDDWDLELVPEGMEIPCEACGMHVAEGEYTAVYNHKYFCYDCFEIPSYRGDSYAN